MPRTRRGTRAWPHTAAPRLGTLELADRIEVRATRTFPMRPDIRHRGALTGRRSNLQYEPLQP
eukprot:8812399-Pyramimonas_sp.AAC.1